MTRDLSLCKDCGIKKTIDNSYKHGTNSNGLQSSCKKCQCTRQSTRRKLYPDVFKNKDLKVKYGITLTDWIYLLNKQKDKCAICSKCFGKKKNKCNVDHDHKTGRVRGLLCLSCNHLLGHYEKIIRLKLIEAFHLYLRIDL